MERRAFLKAGLALGMAGSRAWADGQEGTRAKGKGVIFLWMGGGMSQIDTFDPKPGGPIKSIETSVKGVQFSELLPRCASQMHQMALIRSMATREGSHELGTHLMHVGFPKVPGVAYPPFGSVVAHELGRKDFVLPRFIAIDPPPIPTSAAFAEDCRPFRIQNADNPIPNLKATVDAARERDRLELLREQTAEFEKEHGGEEAARLQESAKQAERLMGSPLLKAFDWKSEPEELRKEYGDRFGINCLLARRLVEAGCPFVEIGMGGWDIHSDMFDACKRILPTLDQGVGTLIKDLAARGSLKDVLVVLATEFGRTPDVNAGKGRDIHANGFSVLLAGAGLKRGVVYGSTGDDGRQCLDPVSPAQLFATLYAALGIDATKRLNVAFEATRDTYVWPPTKPLQELLQ